jgi:pSer/pThr/pTyr-binding forkhead associated (FHA) protein
MKDGHTRPLTRSDVDSAVFLARNRASLVVIEGPSAGSEYELNSLSYVIGRSSDADLTLNDDAMSGNHAAIELGSSGFKIRDMGSTNGTLVNGSKVNAADLKHGDKIKIGEHTLQYLVEKKERAGSYDLSGEF